VRSVTVTCERAVPAKVYIPLFDTPSPRPVIDVLETGPADTALKHEAHPVGQNDVKISHSAGGVASEDEPPSA